MGKFLIIDGNSLMNRAFYALPLLTNSDGEYSNAVYGFCNILIKFISEHKPEYIAVAFDFGKKTFRHEIFKDYKAGRKKTPDELVYQFPLIKNVLSKMGIKVVEKTGIEADDLIGYMAKCTDVETIILSGDRDLLQLIDKSTNVWLTKKGVSDVERVGIDNIQELFNLMPSQVIDYKALAGDSSDNIPGVAGIGEKTAHDLLNKFSTVEGVFEHVEEISGKLHDKLVAGKDNAFMSKTLATIKTDCDDGFDINECRYDFPFSSEVYKYFSHYEFRSLLKRTDIFKNDANINDINDIPCDAIKVTSPKQLQEILKGVNDEKVIALNCDSGLSFSFSPNFRYEIDCKFDLFSCSDDFEKCIEIIKPVLENVNIYKIFADSKKAKHFFANYNVKVYGDVFDINLAKYLVFAIGKTNTDIPCNEFFEEKIRLRKELENQEMTKLYNDVELPLVDVLFNMEECGFKIDSEMLLVLSASYKSELDGLIKKIYALAGEEFNINSPKQLAIILFEKLGMPTKNNKKLSTSIKVLEEISYENEIVPLIIRYRKIQKLNGTYIEPYIELAKKSKGIIHTVFNQTLTSTGRLSSSEPNLQNIPVRDEEGKNLRKMFVSKFDGGSIMSADYNQIELRLLASFSGDKKLIEAFNNGQDIHSATASQIFDVPLSSVTPALRREAKAVNFGVVYGISDYGLAQNVGISRTKAKEYIERYFEIYPDIKTYMNKNIEDAKKAGFSTTLLGRRRKIPELSSSNYATRMFGERVAMNMPLQGSASDIIKVAMIKVSKELKQMKLKSELILQIHDELIIDVYPGEKDIVAKILKNNMEDNKFNLSVSIPVEVNCGKNWFDCK